MVRSLFILLAVALAMPSAFAGWSSHGSFEPDYAEDVSRLLMFPEPSTAGANVYFNAWLSVEGSSLNPNVGATQSRVSTPSFQQPVAFLGVWRDCNDDGYIGMAESALTEYRAELLLDDQYCAPGSLHNHDDWVFEFIWIGSADNTPDPTGMPFVINDTESRVWGDYRLPGGDLSGGSSCYINPATGQLSSTGGFLAFGDCSTDRTVANGVNAVDRDGLCAEDAGVCTPPINLGLAFEDAKDPACSSSALNVDLDTFSDDPSCPDADPETFGRSNQGDRMFTATDCDASQRIDPGVKSPLSDEAITVFVPGVATPALNNQDGSAYEALNHTYAGTYYECEAEEDDFAPYVNPEAEVASDQSVKREPDWQLQFSGYEIESVGIGFLRWDFREDGIPFETDPYVNETDAARGEMPNAFGLGYPTNVAAYNIVPMWYSGVSSTNPDAVPVRESETAVAGAPPAYYVFYASVGTSTVAFGALTPGGQGVYGNEWCAGNTQDVVLGFDCNGARWWKEEHGASDMPLEYYTDRAIGIVPGQFYQLRDVDCYDGTLSSAAPGVGLGLTLLDEEVGPC